MQVTTTGFFVGGHVSVEIANGGTAFTDSLTVYLSGDGRESEEDRHLAHGDLGVELFLPGEQRLRPHIGMALTAPRRSALRSPGWKDGR
jgi:hypothetical protein